MKFKVLPPQTSPVYGSEMGFKAFPNPQHAVAAPGSDCLLTVLHWLGAQLTSFVPQQCCRRLSVCLSVRVRQHGRCSVRASLLNHRLLPGKTAAGHSQQLTDTQHNHSSNNGQIND